MKYSVRRYFLFFATVSSAVVGCQPVDALLLHNRTDQDIRVFRGDWDGPCSSENKHLVGVVSSRRDGELLLGHKSSEHPCVFFETEKGTALGWLDKESPSVKVENGRMGHATIEVTLGPSPLRESPPQ